MKQHAKKALVILVLLAASVTWAACQTTRAGFESPTYEVQPGKTTDFELRVYPEMQVVATKTSDDTGRDGSFMRLFRYIDKGNEDAEKIAMTTPVLMADGAMHFVVPKAVANNGTPAPNNDAVIRKTIPAGLFAAMRFGKRSEAEAAAKLLIAKLKEAGRKTVGSPMFAYYDPPWTPQALRRNEVLIRLAKKDS